MLDLVFLLPHVGPMNENSQEALLLMGVGFLFIAGAVYDFARGRTDTPARHRWGFNYWASVEGEDKPIEFLIRVMITLLIGTAAFTVGAYKLIG